MRVVDPTTNVEVKEVAWKLLPLGTVSVIPLKLPTPTIDEVMVTPVSPD